jgi:hypothetical protein
MLSTAMTALCTYHADGENGDGNNSATLLAYSNAEALGTPKRVSPHQRREVKTSRPALQRLADSGTKCVLHGKFLTRTSAAFTTSERRKGSRI